MVSRRKKEEGRKKRLIEPKIINKKIKNKTEGGLVQTFIDFHICNCLPFVHGNKPRIIPSSPTAEIDD
jgi:hypothetical protein